MAILRLQLFRGGRVLDVAVSLPDDLLLAMNQSGERTERAIGFAPLASGQFRHLLVKGLNFEEVNLRGKGTVVLCPGPGVIRHDVPVRELQFVEVQRGLINGIAWF